MAAVLYNRKLSESKYSNWIKTGLAVLFTKEGIEPFVYDVIDKFRQNCLTDICNTNGLPTGTKCSNCCTENIVVCPTNRICNVGRGKCSFHRNAATQYLPSGCPNKICHNLKTEIQHAHRYYGPSYKNTDATQWCSNPWEVAKCFMPPDGYGDVASVAETDFNGINSVIINYKDFQSKVYDDLSKKGNIFDKGRDIGKAVRHSPSLEVEDTDLQQYFTDLQNLLSDPAYLAANKDAQNAKMKLLQLQNDTLVIGKDDVRKVLHDVAKAVQDKIRTEMDEHRKEAEKQKLGLIETTNNSLKAIAGQGTLSISALNVALKSAVEEIEKQTKESAKKIEEEIRKGVTILVTEGNVAVDKVKESVQNMKTELDTGIVNISTETNNATQQVKVSVDKGMKMLQTLADDTAKRMVSETDYAVKQVKLGADNGMKAVESGTDAALKHIKVGTNDGVKKIESETDNAVKQVRVGADDGVKKIKSETYDAVKQVKVGIDDGVKTIKSEKDNAEKQVRVGADDGVKKIESETENAVKLVTVSADDGVKQIETKADTGIRKIASKTDNAAKQIDITVDRGIEQLETVANAGLKQIESEADDVLLRIEKKLTTAYEQSEDDNYHQLKEDFKCDLLAFNQTNHSTIPLSPIFEEYDTSLLGFYVQPTLNSIEVQNRSFTDPVVEERTPVKSLNNVFYTRSKRHANIYLTSGAGQGKTVFCKDLVLKWCHAHGNNSSDSNSFAEEDFRVMKDFEYIFLVSLRDSSVECDVDDMIVSQIVQNLSQSSKYTPRFLQTLLHRETCLVLLDGLDEWTHPVPRVSNCRKKQDGLPHRKARQHCTILTTTRSWKLSVVNLKTSQIDNHIEIGNLDKDSSKLLIANTVKKMLHQDANSGSSDNEIENIITEIHFKSTPEFEMNPLTLTYMVCLLRDGKPLGQSKSELYANIIDFLILRGETKYAEITATDSADKDNNTALLPSVFTGCGRIKTFYKYLISLGRLAFQALFQENKERSLVFESSLTENCLTSDEQKFSLSTGLLVKSHRPERFTTRDTTFSFPHKTLQEFFAALYIQSKPDLSNVMELVSKKCKCLESILEISDFFIFLCGLCPERFIALTRDINNIVNNDSLIVRFRSESRLFTSARFQKPVKDLQGMYIACVKESLDANGESFCPQLEDVIIDSDRNKEGYFQVLQNLIVTNINNVKSIWLSHCDSEKVVHELIKNLNLKNTHTLECLRLFCPVTSSDVERIISGSTYTMKQIMVNSSLMTGGFGSATCCMRSDTSVKLVQDMNYLASLHFISVKMSHRLLEGLVSHLTRRTSMKRITLNDIECLEHGGLCTGFSMDLSQHTQLTYVSLGSVPLMLVEINTLSLETCVIGTLQTSSVLSSFLHCLLGAKKLREFYCNSMRSENDLNTLINIIPQLVNVKKLAVVGSDIQDKVLKLPPDNASIELIYMNYITMSSSSLQLLVKQVEQLQQSVKVVLHNCTVTPVEVYETITDYIRSSGRFEVVCDGKGEDMYGFKYNTFSFRTIRY